MNQYKVAVVDDDSGIRTFLAQFFALHDIDACVYSEAERLLTEQFDPRISLGNQPDLVMIDMQLEQGKMQGLELVSELMERDAPSEILVISGALPGEDLAEVIKMGATMALVKPFRDLFDVVAIAKRLSETGKRRRLYRVADRHQAREADGTRLRRPVFLSYSTKDRVLATGLRRNLEACDIAVWYAPEAIEVGSVWKDRIKQGIDEASILVALITDNYLASGACMGEFTRFHARVKTGLVPLPLILPVIGALSEQGRRNSWFDSILYTYQCADISVRFVDGLTVVVGRIQTYLAEQSAASTANHSVPSATTRLARRGEIA